MQTVSKNFRLLVLTGLFLVVTAVHAGPTFPASASDLQADALMNTINLEDVNVEFKMSKGGTSCYIQATLPGAASTTGAFVSKNSATNPETEVVSYRLGRFLGQSHLFGHGTPWVLKKNSIARFRQLLQANSYTGHKEKNRIAILAQLKNNPDALYGAFKIWGSARPIGCDYLVNPSGGGNGTLRSGTAISAFIKASGAKPSDESMSLSCAPDGSASQVTLAKQLSNIFVVDALSGQWDRFSGGNLQVTVTGGVVQFVSLDNGGAGITSSGSYMDRYFEFNSRFDRNTIAKLADLNAFLQGQSSSLMGFGDRSQLLGALGLSEASGPKFQAALSRFMTKVEGLRKTYGDEKVFF